ncbi:MAG TPA: single-stranded-DNA-specific exonuclease RecJ [Pseudoxanthomonas sp.]|nr:single-stranded-DNA-specific exonuclease RecJ [Pseudoxanthomonas sp.]
MKATPRIRRRTVAASAANWPASVLPLLQRIYAGRGAFEFDQAQPRLAQLLPPEGLSGLAAAVELLQRTMAEQRHIVVVGDFDCDGATACAVMVRGLRALGAAQVTATVPNRIVHGYGLSPSLVEEIAALQPALLVTVDHGIACHAGIASAKARGWQVLVTDHHLPGEALPPADVIVNPNQRGDAFASKAMAGVGVAFYVLLALRKHLRDAGAFASASAEPDLSRLLDLVAVGTVADLVPLDTNNRALVSAGLRRLRQGQGSAGLRALIEVAGRDARHLTATDIGYAIAPRLNAAGRLEDMALGIECLLTDDATQAREMAEVLNGINAERRGVQQQMTDEANAALARLPNLEEAPHAVCLFDPDWHPGVVGLVASKIKESLHRPVIAFAPAEPGSEQLRGSARSIAGFHIRDALAAIDATAPGLIQRFGGHAMAAGLSLERAQLPAFERAFSAVARSLLDDSLLQSELLSDGELQADEFDRRHAEALRDGGPWGQAFPEPLFDGRFEVLDARKVGDRHLKLSLRVAGRSQPLAAIHFGGWRDQALPKYIHAAFQLDTDDYQDRRGVQLILRHWEPAGE